MRKWAISLIFLALRIVSHVPSHTLRKIMLNNLFRSKIHWQSVIYGGVEIRSPWKLTMDEGATIGHRCVLDARRGLHIGANTNLSSEVMIWTLQHNHQDPNFGTVGGAVNIGRYCWLGPRVIVLPNLKIGDGAVIAAGAVVTKDVEPYCIYAGIPAKKIGERKIRPDYDLRKMELPLI